MILTTLNLGDTFFSHHSFGLRCSLPPLMTLAQLNPHIRSEAELRRDARTSDGAYKRRDLPQSCEHDYLNEDSPHETPKEALPEQDRLDGFMNTVKQAVKNPLQAKLLIDAKFVKEMYTAEDNLRMVLAPVLHGGRCALCCAYTDDSL